MDLTAREVARLLQESERTVFHLADSGQLPAHRVQEQYRFNSVEVQEWAARSSHRIAPEVLAAVTGRPPATGLHAALRLGGIHAGINSDRRDTVLATVAALPTWPPAVDRELLRQLLIGRERVASTAIGDGVAIPHPRDPLVLGVDQPVIALCLLVRPIDFGASDGRPVHALFALLSPTVRQHLQTLAALAFALHDEPLRTLLRDAASADAILARVLSLETAAGRGATTAGDR